MLTGKLLQVKTVENNFFIFFGGGGGGVEGGGVVRAFIPFRGKHQKGIDDRHACLIFVRLLQTTGCVCKGLKDWSIARVVSPWCHFSQFLKPA